MTHPRNQFHVFLFITSSLESLLIKLNKTWYRSEDMRVHLEKILILQLLEDRTVNLSNRCLLSDDSLESKGNSVKYILQIIMLQAYLCQFCKGRIFLIFYVFIDLSVRKIFRKFRMILFYDNWLCVGVLLSHLSCFYFSSVIAIFTLAFLLESRFRALICNRGQIKFFP